MVMEKELKGTIIEIVVLTIFLIIVVPICVEASSNYRKQKETLLNAFNTTIDVNNKDDMKELSIFSNSNKPVKIKLGLMISQFYDEYEIIVDDKKYNLNELDYKEDTENKYFIIGTYEVDEIQKVNFKLRPKNQEYFKEHLIYSFYAEGILENGRL